jgi:hypothetical protein
MDKDETGAQTYSFSCSAQEPAYLHVINLRNNQKGV